MAERQEIRAKVTRTGDEETWRTSGKQDPGGSTLGRGDQDFALFTSLGTVPKCSWKHFVK